MRYTKKILTFVFAVVLLAGVGVVSASAQRRGGGRVYHRPVVRYYYNATPYWGWNYGYWNNPYYSSFYDPYLRERQERAYARSRVRGNQRELDEHLRKYKADGVITAKEQRELDDDYKDLANAKARLQSYTREY